MSSFDTVSWDLMLKAVAHHTDQRWVLLYVERWLKRRCKAGREPGPAGRARLKAAISPLLANMFLHYGLDAWMVREFPAVQFERYADIMVHVKRTQARCCGMSRRGSPRCGLELHEHKTRIVYCKDDDRRGTYEEISFTFRGYTFRPRLSKNRFRKHS